MRGVLLAVVSVALVCVGTWLLLLGPMFTMLEALG
jgi:hypothetical protein